MIHFINGYFIMEVAPGLQVGPVKGPISEQ